jgi:hypothetical protein
MSTYKKTIKLEAQITKMTRSHQSSSFNVVVRRSSFFYLIRFPVHRTHPMYTGQVDPDRGSIPHGCSDSGRAPRTCRNGKVGKSAVAGLRTPTAYEAQCVVQGSPPTNTILSVAVSSVLCLDYGVVRSRAEERLRHGTLISGPKTCWITKQS